MDIYRNQMVKGFQGKLKRRCIGYLCLKTLLCVSSSNFKWRLVHEATAQLEFFCTFVAQNMIFNDFLWSKCGIFMQHALSFHIPLASVHTWQSSDDWLKMDISRKKGGWHLLSFENKCSFMHVRCVMWIYRFLHKFNMLAQHKLKDSHWS